MAVIPEHRPKRGSSVAAGVVGHVPGGPDETKTIRSREGELQVVDRPISDEAAHIAGFNILECADVDEAIEVASKNPRASFGILELRLIEM